MKNKKGFYVRDAKKCNEKRECYVPYRGNGIKICRGWELGYCPDKYKENYMKLTKEDIQKYATEEEKKFLKEGAMLWVGHELVSNCCGANVYDPGGWDPICQECKEHCGVYCEKCDKEFDNTDDAKTVSCIDE